MPPSCCRNNPDHVEYSKGYRGVDVSSPRRGCGKGLDMSQPIVPHDNDILMGRGGKNNQHVGNEKLRSMAREQCDVYRRSSKKGKSYISRDLVRKVRDMSPPGRFLKKDNVTGEWEDVGDDVAREKASQALRDAVSTHMESSPSHNSDQEMEKNTEADSNEFRRSSSAPPVMASSTPRSREWDEEGVLTPHHAPVTPASATSAFKRRRFYRGSPSWTSTYQRPQHYYEGFECNDHPGYTYSAFAVQHLRTQEPESPGGLLGEVDGDSIEFDLFNGKLLETGEANARAESPHLGLRSDTF